MNKEKPLGHSFRLIALTLAALALASCNRSRVTVADMLGVWSFRNTVSSRYAAFIAPEWVIRFNADNSYFIPALSNMVVGDYDCNGDLFRMILHYPVYGTHLVYRFLWEGGISGDDQLTGEIYLTQPPEDPDDVRDAFRYPKVDEIGAFTAIKLSE